MAQPFIPPSRHVGTPFWGSVLLFLKVALIKTQYNAADSNSTFVRFLLVYTVC